MRQNHLGAGIQTCKKNPQNHNHLQLMTRLDIVEEDNDQMIGIKEYRSYTGGLTKHINK